MDGVGHPLLFKYSSVFHFIIAVEISSQYQEWIGGTGSLIRRQSHPPGSDWMWMPPTNQHRVVGRLVVSGIQSLFYQSRLKVHPLQHSLLLHSLTPQDVCLSICAAESFMLPQTTIPGWMAAGPGWRVSWWSSIYLIVVWHDEDHSEKLQSERAGPLLMWNQSRWFAMSNVSRYMYNIHT